jgi:hypothetical protein
VSLDRPIFIIAPPRCGTTLLYRFIGSHPDVGYFNRANRKHLKHPGLAYFLTRIGLYRDSPRESHLIWGRFHQGEDDVWTEEHATPEMRAWYEDLITRVLRSRGATRFVTKYPAQATRIPWLDALFPDALFVRVLRDWRAAVSSIVIKRAKDFPGGQWFGTMPQGWRAHVDDPPELGAAWMYRTVQEYLEKEAEKYPGRFITVWYEALCRDPLTVMKKLTRDCGLRWTPGVEAALPKDLSPSLDKWKKKGIPSPEMILRIREIHGEVLSRYEFPPRDPMP